MAKVIELRVRGTNAPGKLITSRPWEFRCSPWISKYFLQVPKGLYKEKGPADSPEPTPRHLEVRGSAAYTVQAAFAYRHNEEKMREVYYLAGLVDCMINRVNPLLRTKFIEHLYEKILTMKGLLNVNWFGTMDRVLLPLDGRLFNDREYRESLSRAGSMQALYRVIREGTESMFDILSQEYVFFVPDRGNGNGKTISR
ncbi:MAG: hypothetical protein JRH13_06040 [Deltaproteobacteria bacterium]|nr:hypothetical protein [Deltaproteobacteria bacterium]MBW2016323.1 hypothetical protein [Deltaproteobacteria bacterium]MBW2128907.1 hypothetical protein [Deltaproteobacteria bacterium]MBW2303868.1 hypothetical protein [Deltaproteobacteria bacterium]